MTPTPRPRNPLIILLGLLAAGLVANSLLGPLVMEQIEYRYSESLINQGIGLDAVALLAAAPAAIFAGVLVSRGHRAGPVIAFIPATFTAYMAPQYIVGPDYLGIEGNNERYFVFHLLLFIVGLSTVFVAWNAVDRARLVPTDERSDRVRSWALFGVVAFIFLGRWLTGLVELTGGDPANADYRENPTAYLLIGLLDLGIIVPAAITTAVGLRQGLPWARLGAYAVIGWFSLVPAAVAAMAVVMQINDDPNASTALTATFVSAAVVFTLGALRLFLPLFGGLEPDPKQTRSARSTMDPETSRVLTP